MGVADYDVLANGVMVGRIMCAPRLGLFNTKRIWSRRFAIGSVPPLRRTMNLLCGIFVWER
jgi:hypothetical protein